MLKRKNFKSKSSNRLGIRILKKNLRDKMTAARPVPEPPSNVVEVNHFLDKLQEYLQNTNPSCWDGRTVIQEVHIRDYVDDMYELMYLFNFILCVKVMYIIILITYFLTGEHSLIRTAVGSLFQMSIVLHGSSICVIRTIVAAKHLARSGQ